MQANLFYSRHEIDEHFHLLTESPHKKRGRMSGGGEWREEREVGEVEEGEVMYSCSMRYLSRTTISNETLKFH